MKITCVLTFLLAAALPATSGFVSIAPISGAAASRVVGAKSSSVVVGNNNNYAPSSTRMIRSLAMATEDNDSVTNRIVFGHSLSSFLFVATALGICYNGIGGPIGLGLPLYAASGPYLAAGVSSTLESAASTGRLGSDTYKRLALFLTEFNLCGLTTILLAIGGTTLRQQLFYVLSLASLLSLSPTAAGYKNGAASSLEISAV